MHTFRCSSLDRVIECPGSIALVPLVDDRDGDEGDEGSALHLRAARRLCMEFGATAPDGLPEPDPKWPNISFSQWVADYYVREISEAAPDGWSLEVEVPLAYEFQFEEPVPYVTVEWVDGAPVIRSKLTSGFVLSGHIDSCSINPDATEAIGWDLKTGYDPVDPADQNWQILGYAVLLKRAYDTLRKVTFYIVQPRNDEDEGFKRVSVVVINDLDAAVATLAARVQDSMRRADELITGRKSCKWCPAALQCPAAIAEREAMKLKLTAQHLAAIKNKPDDATLADWVIASRVLAKPMEDAEKMAKERIGAGTDLVATDGTTIGIKTQNGSYTITNPQGMWNTLKELLPEPRRAKCAKWSVTAIKENLAEEMNIPKTGNAPVTAESLFDAKVRLHVSQGQRKIFTFR